MGKIWNRLSSNRLKVGGGVPVWCMAPQRRLIGGIVLNELQDMERLSAGSPVAYDGLKHEAKFLKCWVVKGTPTADGGYTVVTLMATERSPEVYAGMNVMKCPSVLTGKGKGAVITKVEQSAETNTVRIWVATASFDSVADGDFVLESAGAGASVSAYCVPNTLSIDDTVGGGGTFVGVALLKGLKYVYKNTIPAMPKVVSDGIANLEFDLFNE